MGKDKLHEEWEFGFRGVYYKTKEDFLRASSQFSESPCTPESFEEIVDHAKMDIILNLYDDLIGKWNNFAVSELLTEVLVEVINLAKEKIDEKRRKLLEERKKIQEKS